MQLNRITQGDQGVDPLPQGNFLIFRKKIANLAPFGTNFTRFRSYLKELNY